MIHLTRQARLFLPIGKTEATPRAHSNRWSSLTEVVPLEPYLVFNVTLAGEPCSESGYIINIRQIDHWVEALMETLTENLFDDVDQVDRWRKTSILAQRFHLGLRETIAQQLNDTDHSIPESRNRLQLVESKLELSPYLWFTTFERDSSPEPNRANNMSDSTSIQISFTQQFEFSAAHRLHCEHWSEQKNLELFGKCNHINGHGHNYLLDVTVQRESSAPHLSSADTLQLESCVNQHVIEKLDHRFLNLDVDEFKTINPTVENISQVIFGWLKQQLPDNLRLTKVRVYETAKTWAEVKSS